MALTFIIFASFLPYFISFSVKCHKICGFFWEEERGGGGKNQVLGDICNLLQCETAVRWANTDRNAAACGQTVCVKMRA